MILWIGMGLFLISIGKAVVLYPGGNRFDKEFHGFSFLGNFLCDLFYDVAYNGLPNEGKVYALFGTYALALTLLLFWLMLPSIFKIEAVSDRKWVRILGVIAMLLSLFIATPFHDWCILLAVPIGLFAFILSIKALLKKHEFALGVMGVVALVSCAINYFSLILNLYPRALPGIQKVTLIIFLAWVIFGIVKINRNRAL